MLQAIGVGFGRTGTLSLKKALELLGFGKCYHFSVLIKRSDANLWIKTLASSQPQLQPLFKGYQSTTDWPAAAYFRELAIDYPDAKFILTQRDANDWYDSTFQSIYKLRAELPVFLPGVRQLAALTDSVIWHGTFHGRFKDREFAISRYNQHIEDVRATIPPERLLIFDVRDGWEPLCQFLDKPIPANIAFPKLNDRNQIKRLIVFVRVLKVLSTVLVAIAITALLALF